MLVKDKVIVFVLGHWGESLHLGIAYNFTWVVQCKDALFLSRVLDFIENQLSLQSEARTRCLRWFILGWNLPQPTVMYNPPENSSRELDFVQDTCVDQTVSIKVDHTFSKKVKGLQEFQVRMWCGETSHKDVDIGLHLVTLFFKRAVQLDHFIIDDLDTVNVLWVVLGSFKVDTSCYTADQISPRMN